VDKPINAEFDVNTALTRLFFEQAKRVPVIHYVIGAISWPMGRYPGYMIVVAQNRKAWQRPYVVYCEYPFWTVESYDGDPGLWWHLKESWLKYFCNRYYYIGEQKVHQRYRTQIQRSKLINPKPVFIESPYIKRDKLDADNLILEYLGSPAKLRIDGTREFSEKEQKKYNNIGGPLHKQMESVISGSVREDDDSLPGIQALRAVIMAVERHPYVQPFEDEEDEAFSHFA